MDETLSLKIMENRELMKSAFSQLKTTDEREGLPQPPMHTYREYQNTVALPRYFQSYIVNNDLFAVMNDRSSVRSYSDEPLELGQLSWLLWITQGEKKVIGKGKKASMRTVPSAGARHPFETYVFVDRVKGLEKGLYHYISDEHKLGYMGCSPTQRDDLTCAFSGQTFFAGSAVCFVWTATPYRTEWRYGTLGQKFALLDAGHVCQNLYLGAGSVGCGVCAVDAYEQAQADALLGLDGSVSCENEQEFVVYSAAVGKLKSE